MGSKVKQRTVVNQKTSQATLTVNERILKECHQLYADPDNGLVEVGLMPCPFTGPKMFSVGPNILSQPKNLTAFSSS